MSSKAPKAKNCCSACSNEIVTAEHIKCVTCSLRYHFDCVNNSGIQYKELTTEFKNNWVCPSCRAKQPKGDNTNTPVRQSSSSTQSSGITSPSSNVTLRRPLVSTQNTSSTITLDKVKQLIHEEFKSFLVKTEENLSKILEDKTREIFKEINSIKDSVNSVNRQCDDLKKQLQEKVTIVEKLQKENDALKLSVKDLNSRLSIVEQQSRSTNLEIQCLPEHKSENILNIITEIGKITGSNISEADIHKCTRIAKVNPESTRPRSVIVKFSSPRIRDTFLAGVLKFNKKTKEKLNTRHIGLGGDIKPFYVVEHLTPELKKLHAFARFTAKKLNYKFVWQKNNRVYLRKSEDSEVIPVRNIEQLELLA